MGEEFNPGAFRRRLNRELEVSELAFNGEYAEELKHLSGLSREEIDAITPDDLDLQKYDELIVLVKEASRVNLEQAKLVEEIKKLGDVAVSIAKKVPFFSGLL